jgi:hypothetical protein
MANQKGHEVVPSSHPIRRPYWGVNSAGMPILSCPLLGLHAHERHIDFVEAVRVKSYQILVAAFKIEQYLRRTYRTARRVAVNMIGQPQVAPQAANHQGESHDLGMAFGQFSDMIQKLRPSSPAQIPESIHSETWEKWFSYAGHDSNSL